MDLNAHDIYKKLKQTKLLNHFGIGERDPAFLQHVCDVVLNDVYTEFEFRKKLDSEKVDVMYHNGKQIKRPKWFGVIQGHELIGIYFKTYPALASKFNNREVDLLMRMVEISGKCFPLVSKDSTSLIAQLSVLTAYSNA